MPAERPDAVREGGDTAMTPLLYRSSSAESRTAVLVDLRLRAFGRVVEGVCSRTRAVSHSSISLRSQRRRQWTAGRQLGVWDRRPVHRQVRQLRPATPRVGAAWSGPPSWAGRSGRLQVRSGQGMLGSGSTAGRTCSEKVTSIHDSDEFAGRPWSVLT